ncbi:hypothetical protein BC943DRAFT_77679 [Umbelopsis sp. AD052]|nr:hypothetical protein BC943DRAFT_77679 [Umbelopsis sp. AD052]
MHFIYKNILKSLALLAIIYFFWLISRSHSFINKSPIAVACKDERTSRLVNYGIHVSLGQLLESAFLFIVGVVFALPCASRHSSSCYPLGKRKSSHPKPSACPDGFKPFFTAMMSVEGQDCFHVVHFFVTVMIAIPLQSSALGILVPLPKNPTSPVAYTLSSGSWDFFDIFWVYFDSNMKC